MPDEVGEGPPAGGPPKSEEKAKPERPPKKERREERKPKREAVKAREEELAVIRKGIEARVREVEAIESTTVAYEQLSAFIKDKTIKDFEGLSRVMEGLGKRIESAESRITKSSKKVQESFGKTAEYSDRVAEVQKNNAEVIGKHVEDLEKTYEGIRKAAEAAEAAGIPMGPPGAPPPEGIRRYTGDEKFDRNWFESELRRLEEEDRSFADNWRRTWPLEQYLASVPPEAREFYRKLAQTFEDRRRLHDYQWAYKRASGVESIINAATILPTGAIGRILREESVMRGEGVAESMVKLEKLAEKVLEADRDGDEEREAALKSRMLRLMNGEIDIDEEGNEIEVNEDQAAINRLGGRLFTVLGFTASYDISDFAAGDFFTARLMHLKKWFKFNAQDEKDRWFGRDKLWENFSPDIFSSDFGGGLLANLKELRRRGREREFYNRFGLRLDTERDEDEMGRRLRVLKIDKPEEFRQLDLKEFDITREGMLAADWADALLNADDARKFFLKPDQYLDRPNMEHFLGLRGDFEHLKGEKKWRLFSLMLGDLIEFHKGHGLMRRLIDPRLPLYERYTVKDPDTGEETGGITFVGSDSERLGLADAWSSAEIHKNVDRALGHNMINKSYAEWLLRKKIDLFGIPGIGPVRATKEILDAIGWQGFLAAFFAAIIEFFQQLKKDFERGA